MFCRYCGAELSDDAAFCERCGKPVASSDETVIAEAVAPEVVEAAESVAAEPEPAEPELTAPEVEAALATLAAEVEAEADVTGNLGSVADAREASAPPAPEGFERTLAAAPAAPAAAASAAQSYYQPEPQVSPYHPTAVPQNANAVRPQHRTSIGAKIAIGALVVALLGGGAFFAANFIADKLKPAEAPSAATTTTTTTQTTGGDAPATTTQDPLSAVEAVDPSTLPAECLESNGNPTAYAILELTGAETAALLSSRRWEWNSSNQMWVSRNGNNGYYIMGEGDYEYSEQDIAECVKNAEGTPAKFTIVVDDDLYGSIEDAFDAVMKPAHVRAVEWISDEVGLCVVESKDGRQNIVIISYDSSVELYSFDLYNPEAVQSGLFAEWAGGDYGRSISEIWNTLFGHSL